MRKLIMLSMLTMSLGFANKAEDKLNERIEKAKSQYALDIAKERLKKEHDAEKKALKVKQAKQKAELQLELLTK
jgi:hypothetical protein